MQRLRGMERAVGDTFGADAASTADEFLLRCGVLLEVLEEEGRAALERKRSLTEMDERGVLRWLREACLSFVDVWPVTGLLE